MTIAKNQKQNRRVSARRKMRADEYLFRAIVQIPLHVELPAHVRAARGWQ